MGVPKQIRHCAAYDGIGHQVIIVQKHKDFVIAMSARSFTSIGTIVYGWSSRPSDKPSRPDVAGQSADRSNA